MRKIPAAAILTVFLAFISIFLYSYKNTKRLKKSFYIALMVIMVMFSYPLESHTKNVDGFTPIEQRRSTNRKENSGFFSNKGDPGGPGDPGDDPNEGLPEYVQPEPFEKTKKRFNEIRKRNKKSEESQSDSDSQCEITEVIENFPSNAIRKLVKDSLSNEQTSREYERLKEQIKKGVDPLDIGSKTTRVANNKILIKCKHGRYLVEKTENNQVIVLGIANRGNIKNLSRFAKLMNKEYNANIRY